VKLPAPRAARASVAAARAARRRFVAEPGETSSGIRSSCDGVIGSASSESPANASSASRMTYAAASESPIA
jgi:hypothetical protein